MTRGAMIPARRIRPGVAAMLSVLSLCLSQAATAAEWVVSTKGDDGAAGTARHPWRTLQRAADAVSPGDVVTVRAGVYDGARFGRPGTRAAPIRFRALPGVVVNRPGPQNRSGDLLWVRNASWIVIENFTCTDAARAGIAVQGEPTEPATGVELLGNRCYSNRVWGIFTAYAEGVRIERNEASYSGEQHGIYVSNSADNPVIRGNTCSHNHDCGIQINAVQPELPGDSLISYALVEANVLEDNGRGGGAAINLAGVRGSIIANNLLVMNHAGGIAGWDNGNGAEYGTRGNRILHNTIVMAKGSRAAISFANGSSGNAIGNNVLCHRGGGLLVELDPSSLEGFTAGCNALIGDGSRSQRLARGLLESSERGGTLTLGEESAAFAAPAAGDYRPLRDGPLVDGGCGRMSRPADVKGRSRPAGKGPDIGCYEVR